MVLCIRIRIKSSLFNYIFNIIYKYNYDSLLFMDNFIMRASSKWKIERLAYIALIPISYWFIFIFLQNFSDTNFLTLAFSNNFNKLLISFFFIISFIHIRIQLIKVYEDYFNFKKIKFFSILTDIGICFCLLSFLPVLLVN
mgnify:FL=1